MKPLFALLAFVAIASAAQPAAAQFFISPSITTTVSSPSFDATSSKAGFAISFGAVGKILGTETELTYQPELLDNSLNAITENKVVTLFQNFLIGPKVGPVKVYGTLGFGNLHLNVTSAKSLVIPTADSFKSNYFALALGGGVMGFVAPHVGVRGDLHYVRAYGFNFDDLEAAGLSLDHFDFWRASFGGVFTF